jgi:hypothetical protein
MKYSELDLHGHAQALLALDKVCQQ